MAFHVFWRSNAGAAVLRDYLETSAVPAELRIQLVNDLDADALLSRAQQQGMQVLIEGRPDDAWLDVPSLQHVIVPWAGIPTALQQQMQQRPQLSLHNSHYNAPFVAQHALALLLACSNRIAEVDRIFRQGDWRCRNGGFPSLALRGKTCLLLGYGAIGQALAPMLQALGMQLRVLRRHPPEDSPAGITFYSSDALLSAASGADMLISSLPHTPQTEKLINAEVLAALPAHALLVNVGRGAVIDQHALYEALEHKRLAAAGLDVWWNYPPNPEARAYTLPADAPLHTLPQVVMSPHRADEAPEAEQARVDDVLRTLQALARGDMRNRVDSARGY